jgi:hypothetical protein
MDSISDGCGWFSTRPWGGSHWWTGDLYWQPNAENDDPQSASSTATTTNQMHGGLPIHLLSTVGGRARVRARARLLRING